MNIIKRGRLLLQLFFFQVVCLCSTGVYGQLSAIDQDRSDDFNDSIALHGYDSIFLHFEYSNPDSLTYYMQQGLTIFTAHNYKEGIASMLANLGGSYSTQGMLVNAERAAQEALKIFTELKNDRGIANTSNIVGVIEGRKGDYVKATAYFLTALKLLNLSNDTAAITDTYIKLGTCNEMSGNFDKALEYYNMGIALQAGKPLNDVKIFLDNNIGSLYVEKRDYENGRSYLQRALAESEDPKYAQIHILPLQNMSDLYCATGDTAQALAYQQQALALAVKEHLHTAEANALLGIAQLTRRADPARALSLLNDALLAARQNGERGLQIQVLQSIIPYYMARGDYRTSYTLLQQEKDLSDSMLNQDKERTITDLEALYNVDRLSSRVSQLELSEKQQRQKRDGIIIIAALLTAILGVVGYFLWKTRKLNMELSARQEKLNKASMTKNKLISIIAHDLIGSIGFMPMTLGLSRDKSISAEDKDALLGQLQVNATTSYETLQNMLDWGKAQIKGISIDQVNFEAAPLVDEVLRLVGVAADNKGVAIDNHIPRDVAVFADVNHFKFIFRNLLSNAVKYSRRGGRIVLNAETAEGGKFITFSVTDNGVGMDEDRVRRLFEPNITGTEGTDNEKGNGIGLNLCKEFVTENGGRIWVKSEKNKGSIFYFFLKAARTGA
jgi:signal transduction histidine kinase